MGYDPKSGHLEPLTEEFMTQRPEAKTWTKFKEGDTVKVQVVPTDPTAEAAAPITFRVTAIERDKMTLESILVAAQPG